MVGSEDEKKPDRDGATGRLIGRVDERKFSFWNERVVKRDLSFAKGR